MIFCYPKLSECDALYFRLGGAGLGNLLFPWARAKLLARRHGYQFVAPTWPQLKLGPSLRGEFDSRSYFSLFKTLPGDLKGMQRLWVLLTRKRVTEALIGQAGPGHVVETSGLGRLFVELIGHQAFLREELMAMLAHNRVLELEKSYGSTKAIAVHVRYGDFSAVDLQVSKSGGANRRQPIEWYVSAVETVRWHLGGETLVNVFSDAKAEELAPLTALPGVRRVQGNSAMEDILLISGHRVLVASGSTFSMWASFLGQVPTMWFPGQMKFRLLTEEGREIEFESGDDISQFCRQLCGAARLGAT
jgi:Glycosyl transferase family 11